MKKAVVGVVLFVMATASCTSGGPETRTVLVDYSSDRFASSLLKYFPSQVEVRQGDSVVFRQTWTGEPHSVTLGSLADAYAKALKPYFPALLKNGYQGLPEPEPKGVASAERKIPFMFTSFGFGVQKVAQNGAQPCYLAAGSPPTDPNTPCTKAQQREPAFTGRESFYNSGYIHYAGPSGNTFRMRIAANAKPGRYFFFCNNHGPLMSGYLVVKRKSSAIPSQNTDSRTALREINTTIAPLARQYNAIRSTGVPIAPQEVTQARSIGVRFAKEHGQFYYRGLLGGFGGPPDLSSADGLEFVPKRVTAKVGEKLTWVVGDEHTISFDVPRYFPLFTIRKDGTVVRNPRLDTPAGGSPKLPRPDRFGNQVIDAGTWDGKHFLSSGLLHPEGIAAYSVRISRPGTYRFACLIHPGMVGTLVVKP